jgi:hypothetical protein
MRRLASSSGVGVVLALCKAQLPQHLQGLSELKALQQAAHAPATGA